MKTLITKLLLIFTIPLFGQNFTEEEKNTSTITQ